jgi:hypothetical protein
MPLDFIFMVSAAITALGVIIGALIATYNVARKVSDAIGKDEQGRTIADRLDRVEHQLWENGGSSLADRVNSIDAVSRETAVEIKLVKEILVAVVAAESSLKTRKRT